MKNILKTTIFAFLLISFVSCTNDKEPVAVLNGFELRDASESAPPSVLLQENESQTFIDLDWDSADYGVPTGNTGTTGLVYNIIVRDRDNTDPTKGFMKSIISRTVTDSTLTVQQFNSLLSGLSTFKCSPMNVEITIESVLGNVPGNQLIQKSSPIMLIVTGYSLQPKTLAFVKEGSLPATAPKIISSSSQIVNDFQGYMYLEAGDYKFYQPDSCRDYTGAAVYGADSGGVLVAGGGSNISIGTAGYYFVTADLTPGGLKYEVKSYKAFGVFGLGVRNNPGSLNMVPMEDLSNTNVWTITIDLFKGRVIKFKSNDWTAPLIGNPPGVPSTNPTTKLISTIGGVGTTATNVEIPLADFGTGLPGKDIVIPGTNDATKQKYKITIDVSKPRAYTYKLELVE
jgi:hypothetical protein